jgi:hypothetical protein
MTVPVINLAEPFFLKVLQLINQPLAGSDSLAKLQRQLSIDLQAIEQKVHSSASTVSSGEWQSLKRVLIYWADEVLTRHADDWQDYTLEHEYYGEKNRAWKFYVEAENCLSTAGSETAELFYLAIVLGFVGDIEGAFRHVLEKEMPGRKTDPAEARRVWAMDLQRRILHQSTSDIQGEPLEKNVEPLSGDGFRKTAFAAFFISALALLIVTGWWVLGERRTSASGLEAAVDAGDDDAPN